MQAAARSPSTKPATRAVALWFLSIFAATWLGSMYMSYHSQSSLSFWIARKDLEESSAFKKTMDAARPTPSSMEWLPHPKLRRLDAESPSTTSLTGPSEHLAGASPVENHILDHLHEQTTLLLEMKERIDALTAQVEHMAQGGDPEGTNSRNSEATASIREESALALSLDNSHTATVAREMHRTVPNEASSHMDRQDLMVLFYGILLGASQRLHPAQQQDLVNQKLNVEAFYQHQLESINALVNQTSALDWDAGNTVYNFGPFKEQLDNLYTIPLFPNRTVIESPPPKLNTSQFIFCNDICAASKAFRNYYQSAPDSASLPHVLIASLNENWGEFSREIPGKTAPWGGTDERDWARKGCSVSDIFDYINHKDTRAVVTTQFQDFDHPKVHSVPLGIQNNYNLIRILNELQRPTNRTNLLMINSQPRPTRKATLTSVIETFQKEGVLVENTYGERRPIGEYLTELHRSKFILSPSGMGLDCYRHWESIHMGAIPVIEHLNRTGRDGWLRTLEDLPVAWIDSYDDLTPQWLEAEYKRIVAKAHSFKYEKLTKHWWIHKIKSSLQ